MRPHLVRALGRPRVAALLATCLLAAPAPAQGLTAAVFERPSNWVNGWSGTVRAMIGAGFTTRYLDVTRPATAVGVDVIVFGTFCSEHPDYKNYMSTYGGSLAAFVQAGGVVLQLTQADQTEASVPFLPPTLQARRGDDDLTPLLVRDAGHPLLSGMTLSAGQLALSTHHGRRGDWESIESQLGFRVLVSIGNDYRRKTLLEGAHGAGRFLITSMYLDVLYDAANKLAAPADWVRASGEFFSGLYRYVGLVKAGKAPVVIPTPPYQPNQVLPFVPGSFTLVVLPDTQIYAETYPQHFHAQTSWVVANARKYDIRYVLHLGDVTNRNTTAQWAVAQAAMQRLDGVVPYAIALGNHDYGPGGNCANRTTFANQYFPASGYESWPTFGGAMEKGKIDNTFHTFPGHGEEFLIMALEFGPRDRVLDWANRVIGDHPDHRVILITHAYMYYDNTRYDWRKYGSAQSWSPYAYGTASSPEGTNDGEDMFQKVVRQHPKFLMTFNGHVLGDGLADLESECDEQNRVYQSLVNYQMKAQGGEGYLRLVEFLPDGNTVQMKAYSPVTNQYKTDAGNQYVIKLRPPVAVRGK